MESINHYPQVMDDMVYHQVSINGGRYAIELSERDISMLIQVLHRELQALFPKREISIDQTMQILHASTECKPLRPFGCGVSGVGLIQPFNFILRPEEADKPHHALYCAHEAVVISQFFFHGGIHTFVI